MSPAESRAKLLKIRGWTRQFLANEPGLKEAVEMCKQSGFEVHLEPLPEEPGCAAAPPHSPLIDIASAALSINAQLALSYLVSIHKWPFSAISASNGGVPCAAYVRTPPRNSLFCPRFARTPHPSGGSPVSLILRNWGPARRVGTESPFRVRRKTSHL